MSASKFWFRFSFTFIVLSWGDGRNGTKHVSSTEQISSTDIDHEGNLLSWPFVKMSIVQLCLYFFICLSIQQVFRAHTDIHTRKSSWCWFGNNNLSRHLLTLSSRNWWTAAVCQRVLWLTINQSCCPEIWHTLTCSGEECGGPCQVAGVMDGAKEAGARRSTQELRLEAKV